jgi:hypothetical protein
LDAYEEAEQDEGQEEVVEDQPEDSQESNWVPPQGQQLITSTGDQRGMKRNEAREIDQNSAPLDVTFCSSASSAGGRD